MEDLQGQPTSGVRINQYFQGKPLPNQRPTVRVAANPDGERGSKLPRRPDDLYRVLVAGGSAAECYMLDQPHSWPAVTQEILNGTAGRRSLAHVGNIACSLIPCRTIDRLLKRVLPRVKSLDVIVLMVGASDLVDWFEKKTPPQIDEPPAALHASLQFSPYLDSSQCFPVAPIWHACCAKWIEPRPWAQLVDLSLGLVSA